MTGKSGKPPKRKRISLGAGLRRRGDELGLSQAEIARRVGLSPERYGFYVRDEREPDFDTLDEICRVLATTPNELLGYASPFSDSRAREIAQRLGGLDDEALNAVAHALGTIVRAAPDKREEAAPETPPPPPKPKRGQRAKQPE